MQKLNSVFNLPSAEELARLNRWKDELEQMDTEYILRWSFEQYFPRLALVVSPYLSSSVLIDLLSRRFPEIDLYCIDPGQVGQETSRYMKLLEKRYNVTILNVNRNSLGGRHREVSRFRWNLREVLRGYDAILCGSRRDHDPSLARLPIIQWDHHYETVRIAPLARWTRRALWNRIHRESLLYNHFYDKILSPHKDSALIRAPLFEFED